MAISNNHVLFCLFRDNVEENQASDSKSEDYVCTDNKLHTTGSYLFLYTV